MVEENRNVSLNLVLSAINGIADSIWNGTIIVAFLYKLTASSNTDVGVVEAMSAKIAQETTDQSSLDGARLPWHAGPGCM